MKKVVLLNLCLISILFTGCKTVKFDKIGSESYAEKDGLSSLEAQEDINLDELEMLAIEEELKEVDIPKTIVYVEKPVYRPVQVEEKRVTGKEAVKKSTEAAQVEPERFIRGTMYFDYDEDSEFEI